MLVKIAYSVVVDGTPLHKGKGYQLPEYEAKSLITHGAAIPVETEVKQTEKPKKTPKSRKESKAN